MFLTSKITQQQQKIEDEERDGKGVEFGWEKEGCKAIEDSRRADLETESIFQPTKEVLLLTTHIVPCR